MIKFSFNPLYTTENSFQPNNEMARFRTVLITHIIIIIRGIFLSKTVLIKYYN